MKDINIFCFGFGQVAKSFIKKLNLEKFNINLSVTSRDKTQLQKINKINYKSFQLLNDNFDQQLIEKLKQSDHILISIPPIDGFDLVVKNGDHSLSSAKNLKILLKELDLQIKFFF